MFFDQIGPKVGRASVPADRGRTEADPNLAQDQSFFRVFPGHSN